MKEENESENVDLFLIHCWGDSKWIFLFQFFLLDVFNNLMNFYDIKVRKQGEGESFF